MHQWTKEMINVNLKEAPDLQFMKLFNASNNTNYQQNELDIKSWKRDESTTTVLLETKRKNDHFEVPTANVKFHHVPLNELFKRINYKFTTKDILTKDSILESEKFLNEISRLFNLFTNSNNYTASYDKETRKVTFKASESNIVYSGEVVFDVVEPFFQIVQINPYVLKTKAPSNYVKSYFHNFECFQYLELNENGEFKYLDLLNNILVNHYRLSPITTDMKVVHRKPDASKGDRTNCTNVVIIKPTNDKWDWYYFHYFNPLNVN